MRRSDIIIIGAGGVGCAVARELSRYKLSVTVLEKECDVAAGASGRNSAVVHAGFNNRPGSLMARLCVEGNRGFEDLCRELDVPFKNTGKILVALDEEDIRMKLMIHYCVLDSLSLIRCSAGEGSAMSFAKQPVDTQGPY